jgi:hypothetical protein
MIELQLKKSLFAYCLKNEAEKKIKKNSTVYLISLKDKVCIIIYDKRKYELYADDLNCAINDISPDRRTLTSKY